MPRAIVSDTSCFIVLSNIGELDLLQKIYGEVLTTPEVATEYGDPLPAWIKVIPLQDKSHQRILELQLDNGEASAIALALEIPDCTVIIDDERARRVARRLGLDITGTLGVIVSAKKKRLIPSVKPYLTKIKSAGFRLAVDLEAVALREAGEN